jgi:cell division protein FtsQ
MSARSKGTRRQTMNRRRKGVLSVMLPWVRRFGVLLIIVFVVLGASAWLLMSGNVQKAGDAGESFMSRATASVGFKVKDILVEGRVYADALGVRQSIDIKPGEPLFAFDPSKLKTKIEALQWIKSAHVERRLPDTVYVRLEEHSPLALWQKDQTLYLLNEEGVVIETRKLARFKDLMIVIGDDAPAHAPELLANLRAEPDVIGMIATARRIDQRRWDLVTTNDVTIRLPEVDLGLALRRLADAQRADKILQKDITAVDLRESDRMTIRTRPGVLEEYRARQASLNTAGDDI